MPRNKGGMFFTFVWPIVLMVLFGFAFGGRGTAPAAKIRIAVVDEDNSDGSREFAGTREPRSSFADDESEADTAVRLGHRTAYIAIRPGFGEASERMFYGPSKEIEVGVDPRASSGGRHDRRPADETGGRGHAEVFTASQALHRHARPAAGKQRRRSAVATAKITSKAVARERRGPQNAFDVTFPQGIVWGLIGCVMTFGISLVTERTHGTLVRLRMAPLTRAQILGGKALACFVTIMIVEVILLPSPWASACALRPYMILSSAASRPRSASSAS